MLCPRYVSMSFFRKSVSRVSKKRRLSGGDRGRYTVRGAGEWRRGAAHLLRRAVRRVGGRDGMNRLAGCLLYSARAEERGTGLGAAHCAAGRSGDLAALRDARCATYISPCTSQPGTSSCFSPSSSRCRRRGRGRACGRDSRCRSLYRRPPPLSSS